MKNLHPHEQVDLLLLSLESGKHNDIISLTKELKHCYKTYESFINTKDINAFHNEKLIDLILSLLIKDEKSIIPSLLNLIRIVCRNDGNKTLIGNKGGIEIILQIMEFYFDHIDIQQNACLTLWAISLDINNRLLIKNKGGIEIIVRTMKLNPNHIKIQENACGVLSSIAYGNDNEIKTIIGKYIELILKAMKIHFNHVAVQRVACCVLGNITSIYNNKILVRNKGGIEIILRAMKFHLNHVGMQHSACMTLLNLIIMNDDNAILIKKNGGIELIFHAMKLNSSSSAYCVTNYAISALKIFAINEKNRELINKLGFKV